MGVGDAHNPGRRVNFQFALKRRHRRGGRAHRIGRGSAWRDGRVGRQRNGRVRIISERRGRRQRRLDEEQGQEDQRDEGNSGTALCAFAPLRAHLPRRIQVHWLALRIA